MFLTLYKTLDSDNVINKTLSSPEQIEINLKRDTDIYAPEIVLNKVAGIDFFDYNYCHISEVDKFYFIDRIEVLNSEIFKLYLSSDVLENNKTDILSSNCLFYRKIKTGDYLDVEIEQSFNKTITKHESNKGFEGENTLIISVVGG